MKAIRLLLTTLALAAALGAQNAALMPTPKLQLFTANGTPLTGGLIYTYAAGTTTPLATYTDGSASVANSNPITLDAGGFAPSIWLGSAAYKIVATDSTGVTQWTQDNVTSSVALSSSLFSQLGGSGGATSVGYKAPFTGTVTRPVASALSDLTLNVMDFGAKRDGVTDDAPAFAAGIAALKTAGGGTLLVPLGTYVVSAFPVLDSASNIHIQGQSTRAGSTTARQSLIKYTGTGTGAMISMRNAYDIEISGLYILATAPAFTGTSIDLTLSGLCTIANNQFQPYGGGAVPSVVLNLTNSIVTQVRDNVFNVGTLDIYGSSGSYTNNFANAVEITGNYFNHFDNALRDPGQGWTIAKNTVEMMGPNARFIYIEPQVGFTPIFGAGVKVTGNWISDDATSTQEVMDVYGYGWDISGNYLQGNYVQVGIKILPYSQGIHITGNHIGGFLSNVTVPPTANDVVITGNDFADLVGNAPNEPAGWSMVSYTGGVGPASGMLQDWGNTIGATRFFGPTSFNSSVAGPLIISGTQPNTITANTTFGQAAGNPNSIEVDPSLGVGGRLLFGTDGTGYKLAIGKNQAGTITDILVVNTNNSVTLPTTGGLSSSGPINASAFSVNSTNGYTGTKTAGSCTLTITGGLITAVSGC